MEVKAIRQTTVSSSTRLKNLDPMGVHRRLYYRGTSANVDGK
jgi:hypothetical protein